jgi:hypothetical protein
MVSSPPYKRKDTVRSEKVILGRESFAPYPQNEQKKEKGGPKRKKRLLLDILT